MKNGWSHSRIECNKVIKLNMMITEDMYLLAKKIVDGYEQEKNSPKEPVRKFGVPDKVEIGKQYYWRRTLWPSAFSDMVTIISEGGSHRGQGWQTRYVDEEKNKMSNRHNGILHEDTYCTHFAWQEDLFEEIS